MKEEELSLIIEQRDNLQDELGATENKADELKRKIAEYDEEIERFRKAKMTDLIAAMPHGSRWLGLWESIHEGDGFPKLRLLNMYPDQSLIFSESACRTVYHAHRIVSAAKDFIIFFKTPQREEFLSILNDAVDLAEEEGVLKEI